MTKSPLLIVSFASMIFFMPAGSQAQVSVPILSFEDGSGSPSGWTFWDNSNATFTWEDSLFHWGNRSVSIVSPNTCSWTIYDWHTIDYISIDPDDSYALSVWYYWSELPADRENAEIIIYLYDLNGTSMGGHGCQIPNYNSSSSNWVGEWHKFVCELPSLDPKTSKIEISLQRVCRDAVNTSAILYYDDVELRSAATCGNGMWGDATDLGTGWCWLEWFGYFNFSFDPWIYHMEHNFLFPFGTSTSSITFFDPAMGTFWWTSETSYPYVYRFSDNEWLWYQEGSGGPRWFNKLSDGSWESW